MVIKRGEDKEKHTKYPTCRDDNPIDQPLKGGLQVNDNPIDQPL